MAAVLACGDGAVLSHRSAGELWRILRPRVRQPSAAGRRGDGDPVDVTVPGDGGRARRNGIRLHRSLTLSPADSTLQAGIPVTKPARTLQDLRPLLSEAELGYATREAEFLRLPIGEAGDGNAPRTRTDLEAMFMALVRRHRLPRPEVNVQVGRYEVDFLWRVRRLIAEVDGWEAHGTRSAFEEDRARDSYLKLRGFDVLRFTWRQVENDGAAVARTVRELLRR